MLVELAVENYAVIEKARVRFGSGLNLLTGETGSGKSLVVDALGLLFGGRASAEMIRTGAEKARISGIFEVTPTPALTQTPFTLNVSKNGTQGFGRTGVLLVTNSANAEQLIRYTGLGVDAFEGCAAFLSGAGSALAGVAVTQATLLASIDTLLNSIALP